jgi:putative ABC transport system substrate-binding protein
MIARRTLLLVGAAAFAGSFARAQAQHTRKVHRIAVLYGAPRDMVSHLVGALEDELVRLGYSVGTGLIIDHYGTDATAAKVRETAIAIARRQPDIILVWSTVAAVAMKNATTTIPVVFLSVGVPVELGLVSSLARPGGNMTGVTFEAATETYAKRLQLLKQAVPNLSRVAILYAADDPNAVHALQAVERVAPALGVGYLPVGVRDLREAEDAFRDMRRHAIDGVIVVSGAFTWTNRQRIADLALDQRLPSAHAFRESIVVGGLIGLGPSLPDIARQGAAYVDKIIKGARTGDLPVEQPTKYELHINLKTAKSLGLTLPQSLLFRADHVIE